ncbi:FlgD immunoglobulin-like domain containing protein [Ignavibacterium sp.]|uniref:FlgD immunoglobulin-like domain containing protein n=1 Tax=Ignavibacterium sp. TaxID=2651167 RepID=UPI00307D81AB
MGQQNTFNKEAELKKFVERGGKVVESSTNTYTLYYKDGTQKVISFNNSLYKKNFLQGFENTIINVWEIDTTLYANRFSYWQKVDIVNATREIVFAEDVNQNGFLELYGFSEYNYPSPYVGPVVIFEQNTQGIFNKIYSYDSNSVFVQGIGDVNSDGNKEVHLRTIDTLNGKFYKADSLGVLPTTFDFIFYYYPNQIQDEKFSDFDKNKITDCVFVDGNNPSKVIVSEYRNTANNFLTTFEMTINDDVPGGFAIGDFDQDRKTELVFGTALQQLYVIEAEDTNHYTIVWQGLAPTYNAYMITQTNDIDSNGKPEFWVGGRDFSTGISTFWCYEADGDNNYIPVAGIELRYLVTLYTNYLQSADIDNDGKAELIVSIGNYLLLLKFTGKPNQHSYGIFYAKIDELSQPGAEFLPVTIIDLNKDGKKDILLPMEKYVNPNTEFFSYLLIQDTVSSVTNENLRIPDKYNLLQNFPNPFNSSTQVKIILKELSLINLTIYDLLGKEVKTLLNKELPAGEYTFEWYGKDSNGNILNSGVYFIKMKANGYQKTIKSLLMK